MCQVLQRSVAALPTQGVIHPDGQIGYARRSLGVLDHGEQDTEYRGRTAARTAPSPCPATVPASWDSNSTPVRGVLGTLLGAVAIPLTLLGAGVIQEPALSAVSSP